jgi:hypothetical protein
MPFAQTKVGRSTDGDFDTGGGATELAATGSGSCTTMTVCPSTSSETPSSTSITT